MKVKHNFPLSLNRTRQDCRFRIIKIASNDDKGTDFSFLWLQIYIALFKSAKRNRTFGAHADWIFLEHTACLRSWARIYALRFQNYHITVEYISMKNDALLFAWPHNTDSFLCPHSFFCSFCLRNKCIFLSCLHYYMSWHGLFRFNVS